jgi:hypothetical protein
MYVWTVETLDEIVDAELDRLPADMKARFVRVAEWMNPSCLSMSGCLTSGAYLRSFGQFGLKEKMVLLEGSMSLPPDGVLSLFMRS